MCNLEMWLAALWRLQYRQMRKKAGTFQETVALIWEGNKSWMMERGGRRQLIVAYSPVGCVSNLWLPGPFSIAPASLLLSLTPAYLLSLVSCFSWWISLCSAYYPQNRLADLLPDAFDHTFVFTWNGAHLCSLPVWQSLSSEVRPLNISLANNNIVLCHVS